MTNLKCMENHSLVCTRKQIEPYVGLLTITITILVVYFGQFEALAISKIEHWSVYQLLEISVGPSYCIPV